MKIYCCSCQKDVDARLTSGKEIYPNRLPHLKKLLFWKCDTCKNYVGCHHKTPQRTRPLGNIPTPGIRKIRMQIHRLMDPLWKQKLITRSKLYAKISKAVGYSFHASEITSVEEGNKIYKVIQQIEAELMFD